MDSPLKKKASTFVVPVLLNNAINLSFEIDSGASDVSIPKDIVFELSQTGRLDFIGTRTYVIADGSKMLARVFLLRSVQVGDKIVEDVVASEGSSKRRSPVRPKLSQPFQILVSRQHQPTTNIGRTG